MLQRVFYVSEIASQTTPLQIRAIVSASTIWNRRHDVTGLLVASARNFAQVLECEHGAMTLLLARIRADRSHGAIHLQSEELIRRRRFSQWAMAFVQREDLAEELAWLYGGERSHEEKSAMLEELEKSGRDFLPEL